MLGRKAGRRRIIAVVAVLCFGIGLGLGLRGGAPGPAASVASMQAPSPAPRAATGVANVAGDVRGVYVVRHWLRTPETVEAAVARAADVGANALFLQVNGRGEAYYESNVTVKAPDAAPGFDPLAYALARARARGLKVHAWINAYTAGMLVETPADARHVLNRHPEWVTVDRTGRSLWDYPWQEAQIYVPARMLDPGLPQVEDYVVEMVREVAENYDLDGIHLDYVRYPSTRFGFHPDSASRFAEDHGFDPLALIQDAPAFVAVHGRPEFQRRVALWDDWRRQRVTDLVARLRRELGALRPGLVFSVAVDPDPSEAVAERLQDWPRWLAEGLVDAVVPMTYSADGGLVRTRVAEAVALAEGADVPVYAALGAYMVAEDPRELRAQIAGALQVGAAGVVVFSQDTLEEHGPAAAAVAEAWGMTGR